MSATEPPLRCRICVDEQGKRIVDTVAAEDEAELLDHVVKDHWQHPESKMFVRRRKATSTCKNCGEEFLTQYDTGGLGIVVEAFCPMCRYDEPIRELTVSRVPTEEFIRRVEERNTESVGTDTAQGGGA